MTSKFSTWLKPKSWLEARRRYGENRDWITCTPLCARALLQPKWVRGWALFQPWELTLLCMRALLQPKWVTGRALFQPWVALHTGIVAAQMNERPGAVSHLNCFEFCCCQRWGRTLSQSKRPCDDVFSLTHHCNTKVKVNAYLQKSGYLQGRLPTRHMFNHKRALKRQKENTETQRESCRAIQPKTPLHRPKQMIAKS